MIDIVKSNQFYETLDLDSAYIFIQTLSYLSSTRILLKFNHKTFFCN